MPFQEKRVKADGFSIRYWEAGQGRPVVMLDPTGWQDTPLHQALAEKYRVFALELPGTGDSPANTVSGSIAELAGIVAKAAASLTSERYTLIGSSFGASVALWQTFLVPEVVEALILVSPKAIRPQQVPAAATAADGHRMQFAHEENAQKQSPLSQDVYDKESDLAQRLGIGVHDSEAESKLGDIHCPTLVVFGQEDHFVTPEAPRVYREKISNCNIALVYDAGHCIIGDRSDALVNAVVDYAEHWETFIIGHQSGLINP